MTNEYSKVLAFFPIRVSKMLEHLSTLFYSLEVAQWCLRSDNVTRGFGSTSKSIEISSFLFIVSLKFKWKIFYNIFNIYFIAISSAMLTKNESY